LSPPVEGVASDSFLGTMEAKICVLRHRLAPRRRSFSCLASAMLRSNPRLGPMLAVLGDHLAIAASSAAALAMVDVRMQPGTALPASLLHIVIAADAGLYGQLRYVGGAQLLRKTLSVWVRVAAVVAAVGMFMVPSVPRVAILWFAAFYLLAFGGLRFATLWIRRFVRQRGRNLRYLVVAGTGPEAARAASANAPRERRRQHAFDTTGAPTWVPDAPDLPDGRGKYILKYVKLKDNSEKKVWVDPAEGPKPCKPGLEKAKQIWVNE